MFNNKINKIMPNHVRNRIKFIGDDNRIKELVKAAALLVAEIERLKRQSNETI